VKIFQKKFFEKIPSSLLFLALIFSLIFSSQLSYASGGVEYGPGRVRSCNTDNGSVQGGIDFNPTTGGKDINFVLSNPVCVTVIATSYAAVKVAIGIMNSACDTGSSVRLTPTPFLDFIDIAKGTAKISSQGATCGASVAAAITSLGVAIGELAVIWGISKSVYENTSICGAEWMGPNPSKYDMSASNYKQTVQLAIRGYLRGTAADKAKLSLTSGDKTYREWYYGGVEVADNPDGGGACLDPTQPKSSSILGFSYPVQKYYLRGLQNGNFNCAKYNLKAGQNDPLTNAPITSTDRLAELKAAYNCCKKRSQEYICINYNSTKVFCKGGTNCTINGITFSTKYVDNSYICAESYSLCPYNFSIGGGSEYCDYYRDGKWNSDTGRWTMITEAQVAAGTCSAYSEIREEDCTYNDKAGKCQNYCQYMTHCSKVSDADYLYESSLLSPYYSSACINFEGDSQNSTAFNDGVILGSQRHFSAPIAQCMKETLENLFHNRAGHSDCLHNGEIPSADGSCPTNQYVSVGSYVRKKGNQVQEKSFFSTIQSAMESVVRMGITLSVMFYGLNILWGKNNVGDKKDIMVYITKIALVLYFATGDAWQTMFFDGVYGSSMTFANMVFKIESSQNENQRDGCQFGNITLPDGTQISSGRTYPSGKEYLAIWDTLDCKIMRYLGFNAQSPAANIASLIFAGMLTGPVGIYFAIALMFFGFFFLSATIRALHIFLTSCISIIIFVFVTPVIVPLGLFSRTKGIFDKWISELISFCLQPMILFAYIAVFITVMDKTVIGSATFYGDPPSRTISCSSFCKNADGTIEPYVGDQAPACDKVGQHTVDPLNDSVACLIDVNDFNKFPGLELFGISVPVLKNLLNSHIKERVLTLLKAALIMYLLYQFMDEIPSITSSLIGGTQLPGTGAKDGAMDMLKKVAGFAAAAQERAVGGVKQLSKKMNREGSEIKDHIGKAGNKGKSAEERSPSGGDDQGGDSDKGKGDDHAGSSGGDGDDNTDKS